MHVFLDEHESDLSRQQVDGTMVLQSDLIMAHGSAPPSYAPSEAGSRYVCVCYACIVYVNMQSWWKIVHVRCRFHICLVKLFA